jgi:sec-independent protein translocase protein TatA
MSWIHWVILGAVALLLFGGGGKISRMMGDLAKGVTAFKRGLKDGEEEAKTPDATAQVTATTTEAANATSTTISPAATATAQKEPSKV